MERVWEIRGRKTGYGVWAEVYRNAHDKRTYVARIEPYGFYQPPCRVYDIKFGFTTKRAAIAWAKTQHRAVSSKISRAQSRTR